jgi:L-threonylcarbamoyladenylate synthase
MTTFELLPPKSASGLLRSAEAMMVGDMLRQGGLAVLPTETGYLLAAAATSVPAVRKAFAVKQRRLSNPMHIACSSVEMAAKYATLTPRALRLLGAFTPGPLSVVVEQTDQLPARYVTLDGTVGLRIPEHPAALQVIESLGQPVTATSLNRSGEETAPVDHRLLESLDWLDAERICVVVDNAAIRYSSPSTLVRVTGPAVEILRPGPIREDDVLRVASAEGYLDTRSTAPHQPAGAVGAGHAG